MFCQLRFDAQLTASPYLTPLGPVVDVVQLISQIGSHDTMTYSQGLYSTTGLLMPSVSLHQEIRYCAVSVL